jgi:cytochrome b561
MNLRPMRYSPMAMAFHWALAFLILFDFALAESFSQFNPGNALYFTWAYPAHMSVGMIVIILGFGRIAWRLGHRYPPVLPGTGALLRVLARGAHWLLYVFMIVVPLSGWAVLSVRKSPAVLFGMAHWPNIPFLAGMTRTQRVAIYNVVFPGHIQWSYIGMGIVALHVSAAFYHHYWRRDDVLRRMLPVSTGSPVHPRDSALRSTPPRRF